MVALGIAYRESLAVLRIQASWRLWFEESKRAPLRQRNSAAVVLQCWARRVQTERRRHAHQMRLAAGLVQGRWRCHAAQRDGQQELTRRRDIQRGKAATTLQCAWRKKEACHGRGHRARERAARLVAEEAAVLVVQGAYRCRGARAVVAAQRALARQRLTAVCLIQNACRVTQAQRKMPIRRTQLRETQEHAAGVIQRALRVYFDRRWEAKQRVAALFRGRRLYEAANRIQRLFRYFNQRRAGGPGNAALATMPSWGPRSICGGDPLHMTSCPGAGLVGGMKRGKASRSSVRGGKGAKQTDVWTNERRGESVLDDMLESTLCPFSATHKDACVAMVGHGNLSEHATFLGACEYAVGLLAYGNLVRLVHATRDVKVPANRSWSGGTWTKQKQEQRFASVISIACSTPGVPVSTGAVQAASSYFNNAPLGTLLVMGSRKSAPTVRECHSVLPMPKGLTRWYKTAFFAGGLALQHMLRATAVVIRRHSQSQGAEAPPCTVLDYWLPPEAQVPLLDIAPSEAFHRTLRYIEGIDSEYLRSINAAALAACHIPGGRVRQVSKNVVEGATKGWDSSNVEDLRALTSVMDSLKRNAEKATAHFQSGSAGDENVVEAEESDIDAGDSSEEEGAAGGGESKNGQATRARRGGGKAADAPGASGLTAPARSTVPLAVRVRRNAKHLKQKQGNKQASNPPQRAPAGGGSGSKHQKPAVKRGAAGAKKRAGKNAVAEAVAVGGGLTTETDDEGGVGKDVDDAEAEQRAAPTVSTDTWRCLLGPVHAPTLSTLLAHGDKPFSDLVSRDAAARCIGALDAILSSRRPRGATDCTCHAKDECALQLEKARSEYEEHERFEWETRHEFTSPLMRVWERARRSFLRACEAHLPPNAAGVLFPRTTLSCLSRRDDLGRRVTEQDVNDLSDRDFATIVAAAQAFDSRAKDGLSFARVLLRHHNVNRPENDVPGFTLEAAGMQLMSPGKQMSLRGIHDMVSQSFAWSSHTVPQARARPSRGACYSLFDQVLIYLRAAPAQDRDLAGMDGSRGSVEYYDDEFGGDINKLVRAEVVYMVEGSSVQHTMPLTECKFPVMSFCTID
jgi:hypothetical protein